MKKDNYLVALEEAKALAVRHNDQKANRCFDYYCTVLEKEQRIKDSDLMDSEELLDAFEDFLADYHRYSAPWEFNRPIFSLAVTMIGYIREEIMMRLNKEIYK